ncbi:MAG: DUF6089 family protein [Saprospiraceae bacterium]
MRSNLLIIVCCLLFWQASKSQSLEVGGFFGISGYSGELQVGQVDLLEIHPAFGAHLTYRPSRTLAMKFSLMKGKISGDDANYPTIEFRRNRNLSFRSKVYEASMLLELNFLNFGTADSPRASTFLFSGVSGFYFNPQAYYQNQWVDLQPLGTEGQGIHQVGPGRYNRFQLAIPVGIGFNVFTTEQSSVGLRLGIRKTFTDYLDDIGSNYPNLEVLQTVNPTAAALSFRGAEVTGDAGVNPSGAKRGNPGNDVYFFGGVSFSIVISKAKTSVDRLTHKYYY